MMNTIELVCRTEMQAEEKARDAVQQAARIEDDARALAARLTEDSIDKAHSEAAERIAAAREAGKRLMQQETAAMDAELSVLRGKVRERQPAAIDAILKDLA